MQRLLARATGQVLDVAVGNGEHLALYPAVPGITGLSDDAEALLRVQGLAARVGVALRRGRPDQLPFPRATFDTVVAVDALVGHAALDRVWAEVATVLKPDGRFLVFDSEHVIAAAAEAFLLVWRGQAFGLREQVAELRKS